MAYTSLYTFKIDVTPPKGGYLCGGMHEGLSTDIESPIYLRGIVIQQGHLPVVIAALDYTWLVAKSHQRMVRVLADAANTMDGNVILQTVHQHDVPLMDEWTQDLVAKYGERYYDKDYWEATLSKTGSILKEVLQGEGEKVEQVSMSHGIVEKYASNRRIQTENGMVWRGSKCTSKEMHELDLGNIDPKLRQVVFYGSSGKLLASLNFYTTHPQVADARGLVSSDAPGYALDRLSEAYPDALHMYFNGCGADIANGKFAGEDKKADIKIFGERLYKAMESAYQSQSPKAIPEIYLENCSFDLELQEVEESVEELEKVISDTSERNAIRLRKGRKLLLLERGIKRYPFKFSRLQIGNFRLFFLPAEMFLAYQDYIHSHNEGYECAVAAYGDSFLGYVPLDQDFADGGYEVTAGWCFVKKGAESEIKKHLLQLS